MHIHYVQHGHVYIIQESFRTAGPGGLGSSSCPGGPSGAGGPSTAGGPGDPYWTRGQRSWQASNRDIGAVGGGQLPLRAPHRRGAGGVEVEGWQGGVWQRGGGAPLSLAVPLLLVDLGMSLALIAAGELASALGTGERLLAGVRTDVGGQVVTAAEATHADATLEWLVARVHAHVACQLIRT